jgi:WXG100 family type VII secretion target
MTGPEAEAPAPGAEAPAVRVKPVSLKAYGEVVARQGEALAKIHSELVAVHLAKNAFGKMPEAGKLYDAYTQHAHEVRSIARMLPEQITQVASALDLTAQVYESLEDKLAALANAPGIPVSHAKDDAGAAKETYAWTSAKAETLLKAVVAPKHGHHGLNGLIDEGIEWVIEHVPELPELLEDVTGDTEALCTAATVWHDQATALNHVIHDLRQGAAALPDDWTGEAATAFSGFMDNVMQGLTELFGVMAQTQQILEEAARESATAHDIVVGIIRTVVEWVAGNLILDAVVLGTATAFQAAGTAAFLAEKAAEAHAAASSLAGVYTALHGAVAALEAAKAGFDSAQGLGVLLKFAGLGTTFGHTFAIGKVSELGSPVVEQALGLEWATGFLARTVICRLALAGVGPEGLARKAGIALAKDVVVPVVKDLAHGKPGEAKKVIRHEVAETGLVAPDLPEAESAQEIQDLLDGAYPEEAGTPAETRAESTDADTAADDTKPQEPVAAAAAASGTSTQESDH